MTRKLARLLAGAAAAALASCASVPAGTEDLRVAITIDDMPVHGEYPPGETPAGVTRSLVDALKSAGIHNAHGFVNGHWADKEVDNVKALGIWSAADLPLANHGWSHRHLSEMSLEEFEREVALNEPLLRMMSDGDEWRWFRYPFLDEGEDEAKRAGSRAILARRGYRIAAVTIDSNDWQWTAPYARCKALGNAAAVEWLEQSYLSSLAESISYSRALSREVYGRDIPYVLLLHASAFEAQMLPKVLALFRERGFRFVSLDEAQSDRAYADQMDPALPAEPSGLERKAAARNAPLPPRRDHSAMLETLCAERRG